ncbi:MAG: hypothetical protein A2Z43_00425 [Syntrophobacterales bacterium RBG_19FT_COMBO_59_10]|nr:MAG: hypothetical protein A2Z43_00425 [Syntrophobacterales bacterium RBG_19FT_COMBO_59_10]
MTDCPPIPQLSDYYRCVEDYFETFVRIYDEHFSRQYGFWRPYLEKVIYRYLDCGGLHNGFARPQNVDYKMVIFNTFLSAIVRISR